MTELNPKIEDQLKEILTQSEEHPHRRFHKLLKDIVEKREFRTLENWQRAGQLYIQAVSTGPPCLLLSMLDELETTLNPYTHMIPCSSYNREEDSCRQGLDTGECMKCSEYVPRQDPMIDRCKENPCPFVDPGRPML